MGLFNRIFSTFPQGQSDFSHNLWELILRQLVRPKSTAALAAVLLGNKKERQPDEWLTLFRYIFIRQNLYNYFYIAATGFIFSDNNLLFYAIFKFRYVRNYSYDTIAVRKLVEDFDCLIK